MFSFKLFDVLVVVFKHLLLKQIHKDGYMQYFLFVTQPNFSELLLNFAIFTIA